MPGKEPLTSQNMNLLSYPGEVVHEVLKQAVAIVGVSRAFRLRLVCKIFDREVQRAIFATYIMRPCPKYHLRRPDATLVCRYLEARALAGTKSQNYLVLVIRQTADLFVLRDKPPLDPQLQPQAQPQFRPQFQRIWIDQVRALCQAAVMHLGCCEVLHLLNWKAKVMPWNLLGPHHVLAAASYVGNHMVVKDILKCGQDPNHGSQTLGSPLQAAAYAGHENIVHLLLECKANPNTEWIPSRIKAEHALDSIGFGTALQAACSGGHEHIVRLLLDPRHTPYLFGNNYSVAILNAARAGHINIVTLLLDYGRMLGQKHAHKRQYQHILLEASAHGQEAVVQMMLDYYTNINAKTVPCVPSTLTPPQYPIHLAAARGHKNMVQLLLSRGAEMVLKYGDSYNDALLEAARGGYLQVAKLLLDHGADIHSTHHGDSNPEPTPLGAAASHGHAHMVQFFLDNGVDLTSARYRHNGGNNEALTGAMMEGNDSVLRVLFESGGMVEGGGEVANATLEDEGIEGPIVEKK